MPSADVATVRMTAGTFGKATSLAAVLDFDGANPRHFGAPGATSRPFVVGAFEGDVRAGASCNCRAVSLIPHCNGTHTESVAHLTREPFDVYAVAPLAPLPALLLDVPPVDAGRSAETTEPAPRSGDRLITARSIAAAWDSGRTRNRATYTPLLLVLRTGNDAAPYLSLEAASLLVERGIEHVVLELPSMDRAEDEGRLTAHRRFFGLPPGSSSLADASRSQCTITELARVPHTLAPGTCAVQLQLASWTGDAVPSRPVHFEWTPP